jgi:subtilase family serine protease
VAFWRFSQSGVVARLAIGALGSGALLLGGQIPASASMVVYGPDQLRAAYHVPSDITGVGQTIVIIAAFQSPAVATDLAKFDPACGADASACLSVLTPDGTMQRSMSEMVPWFFEESTDVEWAHAIAPGAHLILVEAKTGDDADILSATKFAIDMNLGDVISMSFSEAESCPSADFLADEHAAFERAVARGITLVAASGNHGPFQFTCTPTLVKDVATPASDPLVTAVGGTDLTVDPNTNALESEVAWSGSGGGFSSVYDRPSYQAPFNKEKARGVPDVAWHASPNHPTLIIANGKPRPQAGTSVATAEWAGVVALADQAAGHRLGLINELLYHAAKSNGEADRFHDISSGKRAWDAVTGLGTPDVANLVSWIAAHS